ncbi:MAG: hypothetical protein ACJ8B6_09560 [Gemmatimonadales bacterium]
MRALPVAALVVPLFLTVQFVRSLLRDAWSRRRATWRDAATVAWRASASSETVVDITPLFPRRTLARDFPSTRASASHVAIARHSDRKSGRMQSVARIDDVSIVDIAWFRARREARLRRAARVAVVPPRSGISVARDDGTARSQVVEHLA